MVKRKSSAKMMPQMITMKIGVGTGMPGMKLPMALTTALEMVGVAPPLIQ